MSASAKNIRSLTDKLMQRFESGDVSDLIQAALIQRKAGDGGDVPCLSWSWSNRVIALMSGTSDARGYRQWQAVGRQVKAGTKALHILAPRTRKFTEEDDDGNETEKVVITGFAPVAVFRLEDTEGDDLPVPADYTPHALPPLYGVAGALGIDVRYHSAPKSPTWLGRYSRRGSAEQIHLVTDDESTFLHELAHGAHRRVVVARGGKWQGGQDPKQEAVAELSATVLAGIELSP
jgi:hypothetical protein